VVSGTSIVNAPFLVGIGTCNGDPSDEKSAGAASGWNGKRAFYVDSVERCAAGSTSRPR